MDDHPQQSHTHPANCAQHQDGQQPRLQPLLYFWIHWDQTSHTDIRKVMPLKQIQSSSEPSPCDRSSFPLCPRGDSALPPIQTRIALLRPKKVPAKLLQLQKEVKID